MSSGSISSDNPGYFKRFDQLLREGAGVTRSRGLLTRRGIVAVFLAGCSFYGLVMGAFELFGPYRFLYPLYAALKVPLLFGVTLLIAIPSFYVLNLLRGVGSDFREVLYCLVDFQVAVALLLAALAPVTALFNFTVTDYNSILTWNMFAFAVAAGLAHLKFHESYQELIERDSRHRLLRWVWTLLYAFIAIQMAWTLRPFVGAPGQPVQFFRVNSFTNAYVRVFQIVENVLQGVL